ncbi:MAG TPA: hypothetical protein VGB59_07845 [Allosphingosinicella sp.]
MKMIVAGMVLTFSAPAVSQTAPAGGHGDHQQALHQHGEGHAKHKQEGGKSEHEGCCCKGMQPGTKMECCEKHGTRAGGTQGKVSDGHAGHSPRS